MRVEEEVGMVELSTRRGDFEEPTLCGDFKGDFKEPDLLWPPAPPPLLVLVDVLPASTFTPFLLPDAPVALVLVSWPPCALGTSVLARLLVGRAGRWPE